MTNLSREYCNKKNVLFFNQLYVSSGVISFNIPSHCSESHRQITAAKWNCFFYVVTSFIWDICQHTLIYFQVKQAPLNNTYQLVERLQNRLEVFPKEKKLWKNAKDVAILVAQVRFISRSGCFLILLVVISMRVYELNITYVWDFSGVIWKQLRIYVLWIVLYREMISWQLISYHLSFLCVSTVISWRILECIAPLYSWDLIWNQKCKQRDCHLYTKIF